MARHEMGRGLPPCRAVLPRLKDLWSARTCRDLAPAAALGLHAVDLEAWVPLPPSRRVRPTRDSGDELHPPEPRRALALRSADSAGEHLRRLSQRERLEVRRKDLRGGHWMSRAVE